jgi:large subunit ribosomal protein L30
MAETKKTTKATTTKVAQKQIKVTLVKSPIGYNKKQARVVKALGLRKMNSSHVLPDNACVRGMVKKISHLVKLEELN